VGFNNHVTCGVTYQVRPVKLTYVIVKEASGSLPEVWGSTITSRHYMSSHRADSSADEGSLRGSHMIGGQATRDARGRTVPCRLEGHPSTLQRACLRRAPSFEDVVVW
jgi:hypothetical protein